MMHFRSKHSHNNNSKYIGLKDHKYSLAFENCSIKNYFSEKFTDCILSWTIPIYYGCSNIDKYFPKDSYYKIDIYDPNHIDKALEISKRPITQKNIDALKEARELIMYKYNLFSAIEKLIESDT